MHSDGTLTSRERRELWPESLRRLDASLSAPKPILRPNVEMADEDYSEQNPEAMDG